MHPTDAVLRELSVRSKMSNQIGLLDTDVNGEAMTDHRLSRDTS